MLLVEAACLPGRGKLQVTGTVGPVLLPSGNEADVAESFGDEPARAGESRVSRLALPARPGRAQARQAASALGYLSTLSRCGQDRLHRLRVAYAHAWR